MNKISSARIPCIAETFPHFGDEEGSEAARMFADAAGVDR